jgi:hypothetical protein
VSERLDRSGFTLEVEDDFDDPRLDERLWLPSYLPQWSSRAAAAARYGIRDGCLRLRIDADQDPWAPDIDAFTKVSSLQTAVHSGPVGSEIGQHRFRAGLVVREAQDDSRRFTPTAGLVEARLRTVADPSNMAALWLIGVEDEPEQSAEICVAELFGRDIGAVATNVGMGLHPFGDPGIVDDFERVTVPIDARDFHVYSAAWRDGRTTFFVDNRLLKISDQAPTYPMQVMLGIYEFADGLAPASAPVAYPKELVVDWFRGYRPR